MKPTGKHTSGDSLKDIAQCFEEQGPCFRLFLQIIVLLDKVIELYRPPDSPYKPVLDVDFPSFEDLVLKCGGFQVGMAAFGMSDPNIVFRTMSLL
jgi:hypothetical protein